MEAKPWEQREGESEKGYAAFCRYLDLPKREGADRRFLKDLADQMGCTVQNISNWARGWDWEERAEAYDAYIVYRPQALAHLEEERARADLYRKDARKLRDLAMEYFEDFKPETAKDAGELYKLSQQLTKEADRLDKPKSEEDRKQVKDEIGKLFAQLTGGVGGMAAGGPRGVIKATERTVSFSVGDSGGTPDGPVCEIQTETRAIPGGSIGPVSGADAGAESGT